MTNDFKETYVGLVPKDWEMVKLGDLFISVNVKLKDFDNGDVEVPVLSMTRSHGLILQTEKFDKRVASRNNSKYKVVKHGQLVYGFPIDEGVIAILHRYPIGAVSPAYQIWEPIREMDLTFIDYMLKTTIMINVYKMFSSTVVERRRNLAQRDFIRIEIPLPPLPEQRAIAHVLSTVRQAIEATEQVIASASELKRSMMKHLFTYGPVPIDQADQVVLKETEIGEMPKEWEVLKVNDFAEIKAGGTPLRSKPEYWNGEIPWVKTGEINYNIITRTEESITEEGYRNSSAKLIPAGTLLMAMYGQGVTRGRVAILGIDSTLNQACAAIFLPENISNEYLYYFFTQNYENIRNMGHGAHQKNLSATLIKTLLVAIPPYQQQKDIVSLLSVIEKKILIETKRKIVVQTLFNSLLYHLMTGKVRVNKQEGFTSKEDKS